MSSIAPYHDKEEWLLARQDGLGGSDGSAVAGINPYRTPLEVYEEKTSELAPDEPNWRMLWGNIAESIAADLYAQKTSREIRRQPLRRNAEHDFLIANVDRQILIGGDVTTTGCLEIKCPGIGAFSKMKAHGLPDYAVLQLQHYLGVLGYSWGSFAVFNPEYGPPIHFDMEADQDLIEQLFEREIKFWTEHVVPRIPPPETVDHRTLDIPEIEGELTVIDGDAWRESALQLREARGLKDAATELHNSAKATLQRLMKDQGLDAVEIPDLARLYYRMSKGRVSWKGTATAIAQEADLDVANFTVEGKPFRTFKPYFLSREEE